MTLSRLRHLVPRAPASGKRGVIWLRTIDRDGAVTYTLRWRGDGGRTRQSMVVCGAGESRQSIALKLHLARLAVHDELRRSREAIAA